MGNAAAAGTSDPSALLKVEKTGAVMTVGLNRPAKRNTVRRDEGSAGGMRSLRLLVPGWADTTGPILPSGGLERSARGVAFA